MAPCGIAKLSGGDGCHVLPAVTEPIGVAVGERTLPVSAETRSFEVGAPLLTTAKRSGGCRSWVHGTIVWAVAPAGSASECVSGVLSVVYAASSPNGSAFATTVAPPVRRQAAAPDSSDPFCANV
jgi:hypothetical protein